MPCRCECNSTDACYDLLLKGGTVIDPAQGIHEQCDVAISNGQIAAVKRDINPDQARKVLDMTGKIVTPGWIDLHTHAYYKVTTWGIEQEPFTLPYGVTTIVDAGSAGWATFDGFKQIVLEGASLRIFAFLHIAGIGLVYGPIGELLDKRYAALHETIETARANADVIVGIKVRLSRDTAGENALEMLKLAMEAADAVNAPLMVHIGNGTPLPQLLRALRTGDIVTHCYQGRGDGILDERGNVIKDAWDARARGVLFDVGHGVGSFRWDVVRAAIEQGFPPDTISSDLHSLNWRQPVRNLPHVASKLLNLGMTLPQVIEACTIAPARAIHRDDEIGSLKVGGIADVSAFEIVEEPIEFYDTHGQIMRGERYIKPSLTIRAGNIVNPHIYDGYQPRPLRRVELNMLHSNGIGWVVQFYERVSM